jgi:predicted AlkP superfamily phosphohydrolase/phosphomutase/tetratricopeptide (TPR) repeat protein
MAVRKTRVLLVGWDAADWKILNPLLERSEMPVFGNLVERGTIADLVTMEPALSPMLWNTIATGKLPDEHGILGFTEIDPVRGSVRAVTSTSRRTKALWNILSQNNIRNNVVSWFGSHPAEPILGACVSDAFARGFPAANAPWPMLSGTVWPGTFESELERLRIRPEEIDEEVYRLFVPELEKAARSKPNRLPALARILAECFTTHAAATFLMEKSEWEFMAVYYIGIDHFSHGFINFHPPRPPWVTEQDFDLYHDVVNSGYRLMDLFLGRLLHLAGPETTVIVMSDHGFHSDHLRPSRIPRVPTGPARQHRPLGILAMAGTGIRRDERIYGANLLDIAPTILSIFGIPAGEDMPGRVLVEAFDTTPDLSRIASWDLVGGKSGSHPAGFQPEPDTSDQLVEQFIALGYIEARPSAGDQAATECRRETKWNLARVYTGSWRFETALPLLEELHFESPERLDFTLALADCQLRLGLLSQAEATASEAIGDRPDSPMAYYIKGKIAFQRHQHQESINCYLSAEKLEPQFPELYVDIGLAYGRLRRWRDAKRAFEKTLDIDPHNALALQGLAGVWLRLGRPDEAVECAFSSIACRHDLPLTHFLLGLALHRLGRNEGAIQALKISLSFGPPMGMSHRVLASLYSGTPEGDAHRRAAQEVLRHRREERLRLEHVQQEARHREIGRAETAPSAPRSRQPESSLEFVIVSGLPRSGTSMMMRMLEAAGLAVMMDGERRPDNDNPDGYYEWEAIKNLGSDPSILRQAVGKVIKVVSMLLPSLPTTHSYKVIFMDRPADEVAASQFKMLQNRGASAAVSPAKLTSMLGEHRAAILGGLSQRPGFSVLVVDYPSLIRSPAEWLDQITSFVGALPEPDKMLAVIRPELYRNRGGTDSVNEEC